MGVWISLQPHTKDMAAKAMSTGPCQRKTNAQKSPRLQLRTIKESIYGRGVERPSTVAAPDETFKKAAKAKARGYEQAGLNLEW